MICNGRIDQAMYDIVKLQYGANSEMVIAEKIIENWLDSEYGGFNVVEEDKDIPLAHTTLGDDNEFPVQVYVNLKTLKVSYEITDENGPHKIKELEKTFPSLESLVINFLAYLDFMDLISEFDGYLEEVSPTIAEKEGDNEKMSFKSTSKYFWNRKDAEDCIYALREIADEYGYVTIAEWLDMTQTEPEPGTTFYDNSRFGWSNSVINELTVIFFGGDGWCVTLPEPEPVEDIKKREACMRALFDPPAPPSSPETYRPKIVDKRERLGVRFGTLKIGEMFLRMDDLLVKTDECWAFNLTYGFMTDTIGENDLVKPANVTMTIEK